MTEGEKPIKFENIIGGIEKISPSEGKEEALAISPEEKAERIWALWSEYRQKKYETFRENRDKTRRVRERIRKEEELPELTRLKEVIARYWQDKRCQTLFKRHLEENLRAREEIKSSLENYRQQENELKKVQTEYEKLLKDLFAKRGQEPDELTQIEIAELSTRIKVDQENLEKMFQENPDLASFIQHRRLEDFHQQFENDGFIWTPSRQELFEQILEHLVILNKNRPMLLVGETGTGKTRLVRAAVKRLTDQPPFEIGEEAKSDIRPLLGSAAMERGETFITYGPLGQALTGKNSSRDTNPGNGGIFYMDEMNGYPPDALRSLLKQIAGRSAGEEVAFASWRGGREKIAPKSGLIGAANLPDKERGRHLDRSELPVELARELTTLEVDYPEQTGKNPETYEMMLAALMDKNNRLRLKEGELEPAWQEIVNPDTKEKTKVLDQDPKAGGTLWRFAQLVGEIQKSYKGENNVLTPTKSDSSFLETAVLDPGVVLGWLREYRIAYLRKGDSLKDFLQNKLKRWSEQPLYPAEDRTLLKELFVAYNLPVEGPKVKESDIKGEKIWSEKELGFLSPRVPRPKEKAEEPKPISKVAFLEDGTEIEYQPSEKPERINGKVFLGQTVDGKMIIEDVSTKATEVINNDQLENLRKENYSDKIRQRLEKLEPKDLEKEINKIIDGLITQVDSVEQKRHLGKLKQQIGRASIKQKINLFLEELAKI